MKPARWFVVPLLLGALACATRTPPGGAEPSPADSQAITFTVTVLGLESEQGEVALALFDSADSFSARTGAVATGRVPALVGSVAWTVESLRPGRYGLAVYHDLNGNGRLDRTTLGPPDEPYGFSNDARGSFGPPKFDKVAIEIGPQDTAIEVTLR